MWTMKLWDSLTTCLMLLSAVFASPLLRSRQDPISTQRRVRAAEGTLELPPVQMRLSVTSPGSGRSVADAADREETLAGGEKPVMEGKTFPNEFKNVVDFIKVTISRISRSSSTTVSLSTSSSTTSSPSKENLSSRTRHRRERKKGGKQQSAKGDKAGTRGAETGRRGNGRGQGCVLKQIHLNVSDLGLGYRSGEEMIFRYCSGPCRRSETNYDKILHNLAHIRKLPPKDKPQQACCRPTAFDDDVSFLDDSLIYHTVRKHSARKCGCV